MKFKYGGIIAIILISAIFISGCVDQSTTSEQTVKTTEPPKPKLSTLELPDLMLQLSDLPSNFTIKERTERVRSDVRDDAINLSWKKGYIVRFAKIETLLDMTSIVQSISIYPIDNISKVLDIPMESNEYYTIDELSNPNIGDRSRAFRITPESGLRYERIVFYKMDVIETIEMMGTSTDYELLKELAKKAEAKIK